MYSSKFNSSTLSVIKRSSNLKAISHLNQTYRNISIYNNLLKTLTKNPTPVSLYNNLNNNLNHKNQFIRFNSTANDPNQKSSSSSLPAKTTTKSSEKSIEKVNPEKKKTTIWQKIKHEANHYWDGTKLLGLEIKISSKLLIKSLAGYELNRREMKQLSRTTNDLIRVVPFMMFIIIPFAELLLPVALKLFPNMLPSTYESKNDKEKKVKNLRKTRTIVADLIKTSVTEKGLKTLPNLSNTETRKNFIDFFNNLKSTSVQPTREQLVLVAKSFKDDIVLDNLSRSQLVAMSKYINLQPYGPDQMLRYRIRYKMLQIKKDDRSIDYEGIDSLSVPELQSACSSRGIKIYGVSPGKLKDDLQIWLTMRLREKIPSTLLLLASAYTYGDINSTETLYDALKAVLSSIPDELINEAALSIEPQNVPSKDKIKVIKEQEDLIKTEIQQEKDSGLIIPVKDDLNLDDIDPKVKSQPAQNQETDNVQNVSNSSDSKANDSSSTDFNVDVNKSNKIDETNQTKISEKK
ncbi:LETM1/MDM38 family protein [Ascoidea rubescens DSM 1968]|uniref:LETM1-domain-containing protein n=1 Tax=Ascoidea rubescens DSM 1968 TaxID=1344418 RepID=A0A1D2VAR5_9ASCO|nr:LETM1-domain-containing protein [Ascoidea rubescens DSM 1968]ODV58784.1 LETM1-domain-containing protein [Ascoidea rubescens DSM 1968]